MELHKVIKNPLATEKSIRLMESENKLVFVVDKKATKSEIKKAFKEMFKIDVVDVNTHIIKGEKRAYVKFSPDKPAIDIATELGIM